MVRFYRHSLFVRPSGGHIFLCVKKDMEERHAKGLLSRPLESGFFIRGFGGETCVGPTSSHWCNLRDLGPSVACFALFPRTRLYCSDCGENVGILRITNLICSRKLGGCVSSTHSTAPYPKGTSYGDAEASPSGRSTQSAWKQCAPQEHFFRRCFASPSGRSTPCAT